MATVRRGQYKLHAYIGPNGAATPDVEGTVSFEMVFIKRPEDCRYAVVGVWDLPTCSEKIHVWDLIVTRQRPSGKLIVPNPVMICDDVDQAIMATLMTQRGE